MDTQSIKRAIANKMLEQYELGNNGMIDLTPLENELNVPWERIAATIGMLHQQGLVEPVLGCTSAMLTARGISILEPSDVGVPKQAAQTVTHHNYSGTFNQSAIATNGGTASVSITNSEVNNYFQQLEHAIDRAEGVSEAQKRDWKTKLWEMSKHPALVAALAGVIGG